MKNSTKRTYTYLYVEEKEYNVAIIEVRYPETHMQELIQFKRMVQRS